MNNYLHIYTISKMLLKFKKLTCTDIIIYCPNNIFRVDKHLSVSSQIFQGKLEHVISPAVCYAQHFATVGNS
jgi:hypothetical protein